MKSQLLNPALPRNRAPVLREDFTCRVCGNQQGNLAYWAEEMMYGLREAFEYVQCARCECLQIVAFPPDMSPYYPAAYYSFQPYDGKKFKGVMGGVKKLQYLASALRANPFQQLISRLFPVPDYGIFRGRDIQRQSWIMDVGCGNGRSFLYPLAEVGFRHVIGCDPFISNDIQYPNGLKIRKSAIFAMDGQWDMITFHHSFEHIPNPLETLQAVFNLLKPGATCVIRIPTSSSWAWRHYRCNWAQLDAPRHFFLHSRASMELLANESGLKLEKVVYDSRHFQFSGSEKYLRDQPLVTPRKKGLLASLAWKWEKWGYIRRAKALNRANDGDQAAFFLVKPR